MEIWSLLNKTSCQRGRRWWAGERAREGICHLGPLETGIPIVNWSILTDATQGFPGYHAFALPPKVVQDSQHAASWIQVMQDGRPTMWLG
uniref:Uncharacterized protein n=1 Tax=Oryza nivara TaxID=4536 RepID=A0A0E0HB08_ORYNI